MKKTTVYLPGGLKAALRRTAVATGSSEAALIREAIERLTDASATPRPRLPLCTSQAPDLAEHVDDALAGQGRKRFGER